MASSLPNSGTVHLTAEGDRSMSEGIPSIDVKTASVLGVKSGPAPDISDNAPLPMKSIPALNTALDGKLQEILQLDSAKVRDANDAFLNQFTKFPTSQREQPINILNEMPTQLVPLRRTTPLFTGEPVQFYNGYNQQHHTSLSDPAKGSYSSSGGLTSGHSHFKSGSAGSNQDKFHRHSHANSLMQNPLPPFNKGLPAADITPLNIDHYYRLFIQTYHSFNNQNVNCVASEHLLKIANPPKYQKRTFTLFGIYNVSKLTFSMKHATSWCEIARHLGFDTKGTNIAARVKDWVVQNHVSSFCDYLLGEENSFFMLLQNGAPMHDMDPIPMRKRGRPKGSDVAKNEKRIKIHEAMGGEYPDAMYLDMNRSHENGFSAAVDYDEEEEGDAVDLSFERSHAVEFMSDDALGERRGVTEVLQGITTALEGEVSEVVCGCLKDAKVTILALQNDVERVKRENGELQRVVREVSRLCKSIIRK